MPSVPLLKISTSPFPKFLRVEPSASFTPPSPEYAVILMFPFSLEKALPAFKLSVFTS